MLNCILHRNQQQYANVNIMGGWGFRRGLPIVSRLLEWTEHYEERLQIKY